MNPYQKLLHYKLNSNKVIIYQEKMITNFKDLKNMISYNKTLKNFFKLKELHIKKWDNNIKEW